MQFVLCLLFFHSVVVNAFVDRTCGKPIIDIVPQYTKENENVTITCSIKQYCDSFILWTYESCEHAELAGVGCQFDGPCGNPDDINKCFCDSTETESDCPTESTLVVSFQLSVKAKYFGNWICMHGSYQDDMDLLILERTGKPHLTQLDKDLVLNDRVNFNCTCKGGAPEAWIEWFLGEINVTLESVTSPSGQGNITSTLTHVMQKQDNGEELHCFAVQPLDGMVREESNKIKLNVLYGPEIEAMPCSENHIVEINTDTSFECRVTDANPNDSLSFVWCKEKGNCNDGRIYNIQSASESDKGLYTCLAENGIDAGKTNATVTVQVQFGPLIEQPLGNLEEIRKGEDFTYTCLATAEPEANIVWKHKNTTKSSADLIIENAQKQDNGTYTCKATNIIKPCQEEEQQKEDEQQLHLNVLYEPEGTPEISDVKSLISVEESQKLVCQTNLLVDDGNPHFGFFLWEKNNIYVKNCSAEEWTFTSQSINDSGKYTCKVGNWIGNSSRSVPVNITVEAKGTIEEHNASQSNPVYRHENSDDLLFTCIISASHIPEDQEWRKNGQRINKNDFVIHETEAIDGSFAYDLERAYKYMMNWKAEEKDLTCSNVDEYYSGQYTCHARVQVAGEKKNVSSNPENISTLYAAMLNANSTSFAEFGQENFRLNCSVCANPDPDYYRWFYEDDLIKDGIEDFYEIDSINDTDFGVYLCEITNAVGRKNHTLTLNQSGPARAPNLNVEHNTTSTSITLSWFEVQNGGHPPLTYRIEISTTNCSHNTESYQMIRNVSGPGEDYTKKYTYTVEELQESSQYHFCIQASNEWDGGDPRSEYDCICNQFTRDSPEVTLKKAEIKSSSVLRVEWSYENSLEKRAVEQENYLVTVRVAYRKSGENEDTIYPDKNTSAINANEETCDVPGRFSTNHHYEVYLKVFENGNEIPSFESDPKKASASSTLSAGDIAGIVIAALVLIALVVVASGFVYQRRDYLFGKEEDDQLTMREFTDNEGTEASSEGLDNKAAVGAVYAQVDKSKKKNHQEGAVYAQVDKSKKKGLKDAAPEKTQQLYENVSFKNDASEKPPIRPKPNFGASKTSKPEAHNLPESREMDQDGNIYIKIGGLEFPKYKPPAPGEAAVIHGEKSITIYASIDFNARAPTPEPPPEYEEEDIMQPLPPRINAGNDDDEM